MSSSCWLTLILPDIGAALAQAAQMEQSSRTGRDRTQLARMAGRGSLRHAWDRRDLASAGLRPWQRGLLATLALPESRYPSAAVSASGSIEGVAPGIATAQHQKSWLHAQPVHFIAGLDRLSFLTLAGDAEVSSAERTALEPVIAEHLRSSDCELHSIRSRVASSMWLIACDRSCNVTTACPDAAAANELERVMPQGPDAGELRRLMTELQMLLHDHPVNEARSRRGLPAINAVWLWGSGFVESTPPDRELPLAFGDEPYLAGIYQLRHESIQPLPGTCNRLLSDIAGKQRAIAVVPTAEMDSLETQWIEPLARGLSAGAIDRVDLILDGWHLDVSRASLRRFWRRPLPPAQWLVT